MLKKTVVFDFDGVIHSYTSGWKGEDVIPDPPVIGIKESIHQIRNAGYEVVVVSTRCATSKGMEAVKTYLADNGFVVDGVRKEKPPAIVYIDDRAICFDGKSEKLLEKITKFTPWYLKPFECDNGIKYSMPFNHCVFCGHCNDIFYDYTHGPYMTVCNIGKGDYKTCNCFEKEANEKELKPCDESAVVMKLDYEFAVELHAVLGKCELIDDDSDLLSADEYNTLNEFCAVLGDKIADK